MNQGNKYASYLYYFQNFVAIPSDPTSPWQVETQIDACFRSLQGTTNISEHIMLTKDHRLPHEPTKERPCHADDITASCQKLDLIQTGDVSLSQRKINCPRMPQGNSLKGSPKRPPSAYNIFFHHEQQRMLRETSEEFASNGQSLCDSLYGSTRTAAVSRTVAIRWKELSPTEKLFYNEEARKDHLRYNEKMTVWYEDEDPHYESSPMTFDLQPEPTCTTQDWEDVRLFPPDGRAQFHEQPDALFAKLLSELDDDEQEFLCSLAQP